MVARAHKTLIWERTRHTLRLRHALREYFPAALEAFDDLDRAGHAGAAGQGPRPGLGGEADTAARSRAALKRARRRDIADQGHRDPGRAAQPSTSASRRWSPPPTPPPSAPRSRVLTTLNDQIKTLEEQVEAHFGQHPDAEIYLSQPGLGVVLGARVLAEFGDDPRPLRRRQGPQELRRHQPDHPPVRQEEDRARPVRPQRPARRRPRTAGLRRAAAPHPAPAPTTTSTAPAAPATTPRCASSPTASSASCTAASRPAPSTTKHTAWSHHNQDQRTAA